MDEWTKGFLTGVAFSLALLIVLSLVNGTIS